MKDPGIFLKHIMESILNIEEFSKGLDFAEFSANRMKQSAIIRELEVIGEAAKNLPPEFTAKHPDVPWTRIAGMRDKLIHHYFGLNLERVWEVLEKDLPELKPKIKRLL